METSIWLWLGFTAFVLVLLAFDLGLLHRKERTIGIRESLIKYVFEPAAANKAETLAKVKEMRGR